MANTPSHQRYRARVSSIDWSSITLPFLSLCALAAKRGDRLRRELLALLEKHAREYTGLSAAIESDGTETEGPC
jgi:regulator of RNase E activity RraB